MRKLKLLVVALMLLCIAGCGKTTETSSTIKKTKDDMTLNKELVFNGYKFELGCSLDDFVKETKVEVNKEQLSEAEKNSHKMTGLYYEVEATLNDGEHNCKISLYVDTSNIENITVQGISAKSDRGWEDLEPEFLTDPNLITCGFSFLEGYDIDKDSFAEFSKELKSKAVKRKNKYTEKYDLELKDDNFGIRIQFDSLVEESDKIYITNVSITNKVNLAW